MLKNELFLDNIAQIIKTDKKQKKLFSTLDLRYAYSQFPLDIETKNNCNLAW